jgi:hypothetical protein
MPHRPMPLVRIPEPFDHPDGLYELKHDGFRAQREGNMNLIRSAQ